ncbi:hypothetical protein HZQ14_15775 [Elizabethkingia anophelis]|nr:hypothetical protein [Elizabethkingia anophelis]
MKQQAIKSAYGEHWEKMKDYIDQDGWCNAFFGIAARDFDDTESKREVWRPKSLSGIENNNGWISISLENIILPIDGTEVHFYVSFANENGIQREYHKGIFNAALGFTSYYDSEHYKVKEVTHYQPIETPKPPIF